MGYTHLWEINPNDPQLRERWPQLLEDARRILAHAATIDIRLAGGDGTGAPRLDSAEGICLNGSGSEHGDTFHLSPVPWLVWAQARATRDSGQRAWAQGHERQFAATGFDQSFCKTKRRPYDAVVCAILLRARYLTPNAIFIVSGGRWPDEWRYGADSLPAQRTAERRARSARGIVEELFDQRQRKNPLGHRDEIAAPARPRRR